MKRSDFMESRRTHWKGVLISAFAEQKVIEDALAAEAAGVVWDPEEEPLPERLLVGQGVVGVDASFGTTNYLASYFDIYLPASEWKLPLSYREKVLKEAARRYNLFPRIVKALGVQAYSPGQAHYHVLVEEALRIAEEEG